MSEKIKDDISVIVAIVLILFLFSAAITLGFVNGAKAERHRLNQEAIDNGYAEYDAKTGQWQWKPTEAAP